MSRFAVDDPSSHVTARHVELSARGITFELVACGGAPVPVRMSLVGSFNVVNALAAARLLAACGLAITDEAIAAGIAGTVWPGRLEKLQSSPDIYLDGAHNPSAARELVTAQMTEEDRRRLLAESIARLESRA